MVLPETIAGRISRVDSKIGTVTTFVVCYTGEIWKIENLLPARDRR
jgi:hypothetical protein